jgi:UDP-N-acetylglucosamine 2-epimerase
VKSKTENEEELLEYYTTEKFNEYFKKLTPLSKVPKDNAFTEQETKELEQMVQAGHNVCIFGRGSKIDLLKGLHKKYLAGHHVFEVKAYLPSVTEKKIYTHFGGFLMDVGIAKNIDAINLKDQCAEYEKVLNAGKQRVVVLLHSIDGPNLLNPDSQEKLADLLDHENIQLICSLDSIKMVMQWSPSTFSSTQSPCRSFGFSSSTSTQSSPTSKSCDTVR